jgi:hypothetical protein
MAPTPAIKMALGAAARAWGETLAMPAWSLGSRERCQSRPEADGNLLRRATGVFGVPAQRAAGYLKPDFGCLRGNRRTPDHVESR